MQMDIEDLQDKFFKIANSQEIKQIENILNS